MLKKPGEHGFESLNAVSDLDSKLIDDALEAWGDNPWYRPSAARAFWQKGRTLRKAGREDEEAGREVEDAGREDEDAGREVEAEGYLQKAMQIRKIIAPHDKRDGKTLSDADWTELIPFYSK